MNAYFFIILIITNLIYFSTNAATIEQTNMHKKVELVDGREFTYILEDLNGAVSEKWFIDGLSVEKSAYNQSRQEAHQKEWSAKEAQEDERRLQDLTFKKEARCLILKKCMAQFIANIERIVGQMKDYLLTNYFVFGEQTFSGEQEYDQLLNNVLPQARQYLDLSSEKIDEQKMINLSEEIEKYHEKIEKFFKSALNNAIEHSDDTKLLKKLFELV